MIFVHKSTTVSVADFRCIILQRHTMSAYSVTGNPVLLLLPTYTTLVFFFPMARQPLVGQGLLTVEASRSHSDIPHSVGLLWTSDQPDAQHSQDRHPCNRRDSPAIPASERPQTQASDRAAT